MKVLHILDRSLPNLSGYSLRSNYILSFQKKSGLEVAAITSPNEERLVNPVIARREATKQSLVLKEEINDITYYRTKVSNIFKNNPILKALAYNICLQNKIRQVVKKEKPDIIHAHSPILCGIPALKAARQFNIPIVYEVRALWEDAAIDQGKTKKGSLRYNLSKYYETKLLKQVDRVTVICEGLKKELVKRGIKEDKIHITPNGIDTNSFLPNEKDAKLSKKYNLNGDLVFGFLGSFFEFEGIDCFLLAMSKLIMLRDKVKALIVGGGKIEKKLKDLANTLKIKDCVIFTGKVSHDKVKNYYSLMDILVYPRIHNRLTNLVTPLKPLEAMSMEKTVLASNVGGLKELIKDNETGVLFNAGDTDDLLKKMSYMVDNKEMCKKIASKAREHVIKNRNWQDITKKYIEIYNVIARSKATKQSIL